jgi:hypothetical protein
MARSGHRLPSLRPREGNQLLVLVMLCYSVGVAAIVVMRQWVWFFGNIDTARYLLSLIPQITAPVAILIISIGFVLAQVVATEFSIQSIRATLLHWS